MKQRDVDHPQKLRKPKKNLSPGGCFSVNFCIRGKEGQAASRRLSRDGQLLGEWVTVPVCRA